MCVKLVINMNCTEMHGQQNIEFYQLFHLDYRQAVTQSISCYATPEHWVSTKQCHKNLFKLSTLSTSSSIDLLWLPLSLPLPHCPWGLQLKASFYMTQESFLNERPVHFHVCILICTPNGFCSASLHSSSLETTLDQKILKKCLKALL